MTITGESKSPSWPQTEARAWFSFYHSIFIGFISYLRSRRKKCQFCGKNFLGQNNFVQKLKIIFIADIFIYNVSEHDFPPLP